MPSPHSLSLLESSVALQANELSVRELLEDVLDRGEAIEDSVQVWAFRADREALLKQADRLQTSLTKATGPLHGVPFAAKDMIDTGDLPTEGGSAVLAGRRPEQDATSVRDCRQLGGLLIGKAHTHEFAFGVRTPQTHNPWDLLRTPGGSSGGSAAAVASGAATWALGTDTLGSVRMPAAMCGVVGLKPTTGVLDTRGVIPLSPTLDSLGFLARTVADARILLAELSPTQASTETLSEPRPRALRVGILAQASLGNVEDGVTHALSAAVHAVRDDFLFHEIEIPMLADHVSIGFDLMLPEATAWHRQFLETAEPAYDPDILTMLRSGLEVSAVTYLQARHARRTLQQQFARIFERVDVVVTPSTPYAAPLAAAPYFSWPDGTTEPLETSMCRFTAAASVTGLPAVSVPIGLSDGMPVGAQVIAPAHREVDLLAVAEALEMRLQIRPS